MIEGIRIVQIIDSPWSGIPVLGDLRTQTVQLMKVSKDTEGTLSGDGYQFDYEDEAYVAKSIGTLAAPLGDIASMKKLMAEVCKSRRLPVIRIIADSGVASLIEPITVQGKRNFKQNKNEAE